MSMRITTGMSTRNVLRDINATATQLDATRSKASSGKEITRPSDDPFGTSRALKLRGTLEGTQQHQKNASDAIGWQETTEQALDSMTKVVSRVRDLVVQGGSDTVDAVSRKAIAAEVRELIETAKEHGNTSYAGSFVFAGTKTDQRPYPTGTPDSFAGNTDGIAREIGPGVALNINLSGADVLGSGAPGDLLGTLRSIVDHLETGDTASLRGGDLANLDGGMDSLATARAINGANSNRIESALSRLQQYEETTTKQLSETEDADFAKTLLTLNSQQSAYQAALQSGAKIMQTSLMDFLR